MRIPLTVLHIGQLFLYEVYKKERKREYNVYRMIVMFEQE